MSLINNNNIFVNKLEFTGGRRKCKDAILEDDVVSRKTTGCTLRFVPDEFFGNNYKTCQN